MIPDGVHVLSLPSIRSLTAVDVNAAASEILDMSKDRFYHVKSPFEQKWAVHHDGIYDLPPAVEKAMQFLEGPVFEAHAKNANVPSLAPDGDRYYGGVFRYRTQGRLQAHVDAGLRPYAEGKSRWRKHWTALMYLGKGSGDLQFWRGDKCTADNPKLYEGIGFVRPSEPKVVLFENNDYAWHGSAPNWSHWDRLVLTVSYLSNEVDAFDNKREREFFVPYPDEEWDAYTYAARDLRAKCLDK